MLGQDLLAAQRVGLAPSLAFRCDRAVGIEPRMLQMQLQRPHALANDLLKGSKSKMAFAVLGSSLGCQRKTGVEPAARTWKAARRLFCRRRCSMVAATAIARSVGDTALPPLGGVVNDVCPWRGEGVAEPAAAAKPFSSPSESSESDGAA